MGNDNKKKKIDRVENPMLDVIRKRAAALPEENAERAAQFEKDAKEAEVVRAASDARKKSAMGKKEIASPFVAEEHKALVGGPRRGSA